MRWTYIYVVHSKRKKKQRTDVYYKSDYEFHYYDDADFTLSEGLGTSDSDDKAIFDLTSAFMKQFVFQAETLGPSKSLVCSPISAVLPLGKLVFGAKDQTLKELLKAIGVGSVEDVDKRVKKHLRDLRKMKGVSLTIVSRLFLNKTIKLQREFKEKTKSIFKSTVKLMVVSNSNDPNTVAEDINQWVRRKTQGMIRGIFSSNDIKPNTNMNLLLVNVVHFKGLWQHAFTEYSGTFHGMGGDKVMPMMHVTNEFKYGTSQALDAKVIKIPYDNRLKGPHAHFMIVLPNSPNGLSVLMNALRLAPTLLNQVTMKNTRVSLTMPQFTVESEIDLEVLYKMIGLHEIFNNVTGLQKMVTNGTVKLDMARQKAIIEVSPDGRIAIFAIMSEIGATPPIKMEVTHPFLYFVISKQQQVLAGVFTGN